MALTPKMQAWADAWLETFNKTEASRIAKYDGDDATLASIGWENFRKPEIAAYIQQRLDEKGMPANEVLARYAEQARGEYSKYIQRNGKVNLTKLIADKKGHLIKKIKPNQYGIEIEFYDAKSALDSLAKYHNLLKDTQVNFDVPLESLTDEQLQRLANGEDILTIMANQGQSRTRETEEIRNSQV